MAHPQMSGPHSPTALGCPQGGGCHVDQSSLKALLPTDKLAQQASVMQARSRSMVYGQNMLRALPMLLYGMALRLRSAPIWQAFKGFAHARSLARASL